MAVAQGPFLAAVLLLVSSGLLCSSLPTLCPEPCTCPTATLLNCSSSGLSLVPQRIQNAITELDLSHNLLNSVTPSRPYYNLRSLWLGNSNITHLSLCIERGHYIRGRRILHRRPWDRQGCVSWAPTLQLLSVERNQLEQFPEGLQGCESLQVLQLSFNKISSLRPEDFSHLQQLTELHLQHNLIASLHPQIFQDLTQLQVLDLSYNKLTSLHPLMYLSLHNIGAAVRLDGNRWQCDCSMRSLRRRMAYDSSQGLRVWTVECAFPSILSGRNLLQLEEDDLKCFNAENQPEVHQDVTVYSGSEILLSCSSQDSVWWTPIGQASVSQPQAGLTINGIAEKERQLYVCVSEEGKVVSVFNLQISKTGGTKRKSRNIPRIRREISPQQYVQATGRAAQTVNSGTLALAVCLSIFFTFLVAFVLGVLARPCIDVLCKRVTRKRDSTQTMSGSTTEQRQYDNEAFNRFEEPLETGTRRERRVTFNSENIKENGNVQYYDTMASRDQDSTYSVVTKSETARAERGGHTAESSGSESSSLEENQRDRGNIPVHAHMSAQYENPDTINLEKRRSISLSSDSSQSTEHQMTPRGHSKLKSPMLEKDSVLQTADPQTAGKGQLQQIQLEGRDIPGFSTEPFAGWSPHTKNPNSWQENNDQFEFSDSVQSMSPRSGSASGSLNDSKVTRAPAANKQKRNVTSSSSSSDSDNEPTKYTVNPDQDEEDIRRNHNGPRVTSSGLKSDFKNNTQMHAVNLTVTHSPSSNSSDTDKDNTIKRETEKGQKDKSMKKSDTRKKTEPMPRTKWRLPSLGLLSQGKRLDTKTTSPPADCSSSSSSETETQITNLKERHNTGRVIDGIKINKPETMSTVLDRPNIPQVKKRKAPLPPSHSISSDDSTDEETKPMQRQKQGAVNVVGSRSERSSSDSDNEKRKNLRGLEKAQIKITRPPMKVSQTKSHGPPTKQPVHGLEQTSVIKRHSDSSSSSDSEDETKRGKAYMARPPIAIPKTEGLGPQTKLPAIDLNRTIGVKRRLDIKAPSPAFTSSSSSDSDSEATHKMRHEKEQIQITRPPMKVSQTKSHGPPTKQPVHGLEQTSVIKRHSDSSSSSDSEDETKRGKAYMARPPIAIPKTEGLGPQTKLPAIDLNRTIGVKRRLDIKAPSPAFTSSSSSDSDSEATHKMRHEKEQIQITRPWMKVSQTTSHGPPTKQPVHGLQHTSVIKRHSDSSSSSDSEDETKQGKKYMPRPPIAIPKTEGLGPQTKLPAIDLDRTIGVKRRLDIKAPSPASNSSSSSDSDSEATNKMKHEKEQIQITRPSIKISQTTGHGPPTKQPVHGLQHTSVIKRHSDSSSSSDSEDETKRGKAYMPRPPIAIPKTEGLGPQTKLPAIDLNRTIGVKRRLDIKAPSPAFTSSSSSDSDSEGTNKTKHEKEQIQITRPWMKVSQTTSHGPLTKQPVHGLQQTSVIKRHSDSSSSSDSEDETKQGKTYMPRPPFAIPKTEGLGAQTKLPAIDLNRTIGVKRRLDIKAPSPAFTSSSSSDSDSEATNKMRHEKEQIQITRPWMKVSQTTSHGPPTKQPVHGLQHTSVIKRHSDSSSSSDSEDETKRGKAYMPRPPIAIPKTEGLGPQTKLPAIDLNRTIGVKRRLDIKAPSPTFTSSSSSDSDSEATNKLRHEKEQIQITRHWMKVSQTTSHGPPTKQPVHGLQHTSVIKRHSDSSSSSDSEDETKRGKAYMPRPPIAIPKTEGLGPQTKLPAIDLNRTIGVKRRLDIKAPSPTFTSSSSSDSDSEATNKLRHEKEQIQITRHWMKVSQTTSHGPPTKQPVHGLQHTSVIKRHSDSSSSSDSEDETKRGKAYMPRPPIAIPKTEGLGPQTKLPAIDLNRTIGVKRRLDIKAPSPTFTSSSSSDSDSEATNKMRHEKEQIQITRPWMKVSQTTSRGPPTKQPIHGLEHTSAIKKHSDSSSSSDSDNEKTNNMRRQEKEQIQMTRPPIKALQTTIHGPSTKQPIHGLGHTSSIKRHSDSSSSSDTEDETSNKKTQQQRKTYMYKPHNVIPKTESLGPQTKLPAIDLDRTIGIKKRLDIKASSPASDSFSSSDSENEAAGHAERQRPGSLATVELAHQKSKIESQDWESQWPTVSLTHMKRRLAIKVKSPPPIAVPIGEGTNYFIQGTSEKAHKISSPSSSSSDSDEGNRDSRNPITSTEPKPNSRWPQLDLKSTSHVNQRLDIKTQSSQRDPVLSSVSPGFQQIESSSSSSDSENENRGSRLTALSKDKEDAFITSPKASMIYAQTPKSDSNIKLLKYTVFTDDVGERTSSISTASEINPEFQEWRPQTNLSLPRFRKRLEITSNADTPPNMISSPPESPSSKKGSRITLKRWESDMQRHTSTEKSLSSENKPAIKLSESTHATPLHQKTDSSSSSSSSEAENESAEHTTKKWRKHQSPRITDMEASHFQSSSQAVTMKLDQSRGQTKDMKDVRVDLKSKTAKVREETDSAQPSRSLTNVSYIRRDPDIRIPVPHEASSSSNSENEMMHRSVRDRSLGVTHIEKGQNIKVSVPRTSSSSSSSSSSSENESEVKRYPSKQHKAEVSNNSPVTYRRSIFSSSFSPTASSTNIDNVIKKQTEQSKQVGNVDLSTEMQWTGTGRQLSVSSLRKHQDIGSSTSLLAPSETLLFENPNSPRGNIGDNIKQDRWKTDGILMPEYATFNTSSVSPQPRTTLNELAKSPSSRERKGLSALKAMSVERQQWDTQAEQLEKVASPVYDVSRVDYSFNNQRSLGGIKPLTKRSPAQAYSPSSFSREVSVDAFTYAIPQYRRHTVVNTGMPQESPPPIPATPPYEPADFTWRSPQSSVKQNMQGTRSYLQQNRNTSVTAQSQNGASDTYNPNISLV